MVGRPPARFDFSRRTLTARLRSATGKALKRTIEVRTHPISGRSCRITLSRADEREPGTDSLPAPPPDADDRQRCPFCPDRLESATPMLPEGIAPEGRLRKGESVLFPNLFPYGTYSAVSLFGTQHFVEIGTARPESYRDSFINCVRYLERVLEFDPRAVFMAVTQNHLPSAGGSLLHPHLQVHADRVPTNHQRYLIDRAAHHSIDTGELLLGDYLGHEKANGERYIGSTGAWDWVAAFAPEGFYEIWGILPGVTSLFSLTGADWQDLAEGVLRIQTFYRSLCRNGYNLGLLAVEDGSGLLELRTVMTVRANHAPWVRNDLTGFEVMLGDMATFSPPEQTAVQARVFWPAGDAAGS